MDGFTVLAEPTRRRILDELRFAQEPGDARSGRDVATLVSALGLPQPSVSKHLRVLRDAGVVAARVDGPRRVYRLSAQALGDVAAYGWSRTDKCGSRVSTRSRVTSTRWPLHSRRTRRSNRDRSVAAISSSGQRAAPRPGAGRCV